MKEQLSDYGINGDDNSKEYSNPKTAVEYLWDKLSKGEFINDPEELFEQAKSMEKQEKIDFANNYGFDICGYDYERAEQYYNETYGKDSNADPNKVG